MAPADAVVQNNLAYDTATQYTLLYTTAVEFEAGSTFKVTYPSQVTVTGTPTICNVIVSGSTYTMGSCVWDEANKQFILTSGSVPLITEG